MMRHTISGITRDFPLMVELKTNRSDNQNTSYKRKAAMPAIAAFQKGYTPIIFSVRLINCSNAVPSNMC